MSGGGRVAGEIAASGADNAPSDEVRRIVDAAREVWIRRLIDPSRANTLLFYRDLKVGTLDLDGYPASVTALLNGDKLSVQQLIYPSRARQDVENARAENAKARAIARNALIALRRKAVANLEEKGIDTLFLAIGMASWPMNDGGRPYDSPVLLVPATIEVRGSGDEELRLLVKGEPQVNPVLLHVLEENFQVRIDADAIMKESAREDDEGVWRVDPGQVLQRIESLARAVPDFSIRRRAIIGNFSFARMAMVEDLKRNGAVLAANPIVAAVGGHEPSRRELAKSALDINPSELDDRAPDTDYLVLDADSTQHRAIVLSCAGQNSVVQGPPGTGKSQTIANLIAQAVAEGKRVLFVAEKRAALEAVIKRLSHPDVGLGHITLDLHGASVSRKEVMARIATALEEIRRSPPVSGFEEAQSQFESRRKALNAHSRRVNIQRPPSGLSVVQILGRLLGLPEGSKSTLRLRGAALDRLDAERVDKIRQHLVESADQAPLFLGTDASPWTDAEIRDGRTAQWASDEAVRISNELWPAVEKALSAVLEEAGLRPPESIDDIAALSKLLADVRTLLSQYDSGIFLGIAETSAKLLPARGNGFQRMWAFASDPNYRDARSKMRSLRSTKAPAITLLAEALEADRVLKDWTRRSLTPVSPREAPSAPGLNSTLSTMQAALQPLDQILRRGTLGQIPLGSVGKRLQDLAEDRRTPYKLPRIHELRELIKAAGLGPLIDDFRVNTAPPDLWPKRFDFIWLHSGLDAVFANEPELAGFSGRSHQALVDEFARLDRERLKLAAGRVRRLHAESAIKAMNEHFDQADLVKREAAKKSRHIPLRELLARAPDVLTRIAPCWIASPLSVSQLLDGGKRHFDLVLFDEASQILQEEAIPSLYRANQVVAAGDRHQLPPTTFFATAGAEDSELSSEDELQQAAMATAQDAVGGFESLLATLDAFLPNLPLEWHYRSADERLIAFSNQNIYQQRLITFPGANDLDAIRHVLVQHDPSLGSQEESSSREVEEVVKQVLLHAEQRPDESLGVIAMGIKHANRVQAALDRALELRPDLTDFFAMEREDRFFVKNLETVQGDERDSIILTVGYGKAADGTLPHRFGPMTQDVGYRRLNVAVTRARTRMMVVSSFLAHEIDLNRSGKRGVQLLKAYLEYAANGGTRLPDIETAGEIGLNPFEADIRDALVARGVNIRFQYGASRYRIDLVAMHPEKHGRPVLAIECDGAAYHSSATARDRDRLRQSHLQRLGWRFHRIWSSDWFFSRGEEIDRVLEAYRDAVRRADEADAKGGIANTPEPGDAGQLLQAAMPGVSRHGPEPSLPPRATIDEYPIRELRAYTEWIKSDGLLRTEDELLRELFSALPFARMGAKIRKRLSRVVQGLT